MEILTKGDNIFLDFYQGPNSNLIARTPDGRIAIISHESMKIVRAGATWSCEVLHVEEKKIIVLPLEMVVTPAQNAGKMADSILELQGKDWNKPTGKVQRPLKNWELRNKNFKKDAV